MRYRLLLLTILLFGTALCAFGNKHYTVSNALISNTVYNVYCDSRGYMWFATDKGASRFDGKNFKNYTLLDGIADNNILNFFEDKRKRLWLLTYNGSSCYIKNDTVFNAINDPLLKKIPGKSFTRAMCDGPDSSVYISYNQGSIVHVGRDTVNELPMPPYWISTLMYTSPYLIAFGERGIIRYRNDTIVSEQLTSGQSISFIYGDRILTTNKKGFEFIQNNNILYRCNNDTLSYFNAIRLCPDKENNIFCCTHTGLYFIDYNTKEKTCILPNIPTTGVYQDIYDNYWVSTLNDGVFYFNKEFNKIHLLTQINSDYITTCGNDQYFLAGKEHLYEMKENGLEKIQMPIYKLKYSPVCNTPELFLYNAPNCYIYNKATNRNIVLSSTYEKTCIAYSPRAFLCYSNSVISYLRINARQQVKDTMLAVSDAPGYNYKGKLLGSSYDSLNHNLYVLTTDRLYKHELPSFRQYTLDSFNIFNTPVRIFSFDNKIIILTNTNHIIIYNKTIAAKICDMVIADHAILDLFDIRDNQAITFTNDGYYLLTVNFNAPWKTTFTKIEYPFNESDITAMYPIGRNIYCNVNGSLYFFEKNLINKKISKPFFYIDGITVNNVKSPDKHHLLIQNTTNSNIHLSLSSLYYNNARIRYKYRITSNKHAGQWLFSNSEDFNITLPDYGHYTIELKAVTENNNTSGSKYISAQWDPPFYLTTWFKILAAILMIDIVIYALYRYNRKRRKQHESELNHLQLENKAINSLLNPHFIFNAINNIQNLVNQNASDDANDYLAMLSRLIRQNIENLQYSLIPLEKELTLIHNYIHLQNLRFGGKIKLEILNELENDAVYIPPLLIHTFVENAVVHGFNSQLSNFTVSIAIKKTGKDYMSIVIADNGIGLESAAGRENITDKSSMGIDMTRKRIERLSVFYKVDYNLQIIDRKTTGAHGTEVSIKIFSKFRELLKGKE